MSLMHQIASSRKFGNFQIRFLSWNSKFLRGKFEFFEDESGFEVFKFHLISFWNFWKFSSSFESSLQIGVPSILVWKFKVLDNLQILGIYKIFPEFLEAFQWCKFEVFPETTY
jgi:hypothetical protein